MNLESQVTSLELSKRLKELGVKQESLFYWSKLSIQNDYKLEIRQNIYNQQWVFADCSEYISAFTASELLELLPKFINDWIFRIEKYPSEYEVKYCDKLDEKRLNIEFDKNLSNACAKMLIHLIENKLWEIR